MRFMPAAKSVILNEIIMLKYLRYAYGIMRADLPITNAMFLCRVLYGRYALSIKI